MTYEITSEQHKKLLEARDSWPERLSYMWSEGDSRCAIAYLTSVAGLDDEEVNREWVEDGEIHQHFKQEGLKRLSEIYGLSKDDLIYLFDANARDYLPDENTRSLTILGRFELILSLSGIDVSTSPSERASRTLEWFLPKFSSSVPATTKSKSLENA